MSSFEDRMIAYANAIIGNKKICDNQEETIKRIVLTQPEFIIEAYGITIEPSIEDEQRRNNRLTKYYELLQGLSDDATERQKERLAAYASKIESVIRAYSKYDYQKEGSIEVNGNTFTYNKEKFDPKDYMDELAKIGEANKGDTLSVSLDGDGRLVIY